LESFDILDPNKQLALLRVIQTLGFHNYVADIAMKIPLAEINDSTRASLALLCGQSKHLHSFDSGYTGDVTLIEHVANNAPNSKAKIAAALQLIAYYGKNQQNLNKTKYWADFALKEIELIKSQLSKFDLTRYMSVYHRAAAFVPILDGDLQEMRTEMDACRKYAQDLLNCASPSQKPVAEENHQLVLESSTKEAILLQDYDLAYQRAHELGVTLDPFDSRYKLELGQVCLLRQEYRKAAHFYHQAFLLGAPCTEIALFMEGQCYEAIGDLEAAYRCYLLCLDYDPKAISALKKVAELTPKLNAPIYKLYQSLSDEQITMFTL
jgi:tetratricopeptide (TPR) repeat protein